MVFNPVVMAQGGSDLWEEVSWDGFSQYMSQHSSPTDGFATGVILLQSSVFYGDYMPFVVRSDYFYNQDNYDTVILATPV